MDIIRRISGGVGRFFSSFVSVFKNPKKFIWVFALAGVWLVLNILQSAGVNPIPVRVLSTLTFAEGGMHGGILGAVGGIIGKGLFASALAFHIGVAAKTITGSSYKSTVKGLFSISADTLWSYLAGAGCALLAYLIIAGGAVKVSFMGGLGASCVAARSGQAPYLRGLSLGFVAGAFLGVLEIGSLSMGMVIFILGLALAVGGGVMMILQKTGVIKTGKGGKKL